MHGHRSDNASIVYASLQKPERQFPNNIQHGKLAEHSMPGFHEPERIMIENVLKLI